MQLSRMFSLITTLSSENFGAEKSYMPIKVLVIVRGDPSMRQAVGTPEHENSFHMLKPTEYF